ncbi:uncharacterized protein LOC129220907 [Uloborus diversus]|uniref:uncharacterized protein LOC129220907 n=1 Tax=Uloborus diversus TaxID=327109 RepID=UPI0024090D5B|nr:uncharacterized protein LOC129220907 [Uloborus diversus]
MKIISKSVEQSYLRPCVSPIVGLPGAHFHTELMSVTNKHTDAPDYLRQLALEVIDGIPSDAILIYTDGSKDELNNTGSGVFIESLSVQLSRRNPDNCSVFRSELIAINEGLNTILHDTKYGDIWILTDSRSSIQYLQNWSSVCDLVGIQIITHLKNLTKGKEVHFQWIPSHVNIHGNEAADILAKRGCSELPNKDFTLTYKEIFSMKKQGDRQVWITPPAHPWYCRKTPGGSLDFRG